MDRITVHLLYQPLNLALSTSDPSLINGWSHSKRCTPKTTNTLSQNELASIWVTEEQVESRVLINRAWLFKIRAQYVQHEISAIDTSPIQSSIRVICQPENSSHQRISQVEGYDLDDDSGTEEECSDWSPASERPNPQPHGASAKLYSPPDPDISPIMSDIFTSESNGQVLSGKSLGYSEHLLTSGHSDPSKRGDSKDAENGLEKRSKANNSRFSSDETLKMWSRVPKYPVPITDVSDRPAQESCYQQRSNESYSQQQQCLEHRTSPAASPRLGHASTSLQPPARSKRLKPHDGFAGDLGLHESMQGGSMEHMSQQSQGGYSQLPPHNYHDFHFSAPGRPSKLPRQSESCEWDSFQDSSRVIGQPAMPAKAPKLQRPWPQSIPEDDTLLIDLKEIDTANYTRPKKVVDSYPGLSSFAVAPACQSFRMPPALHPFQFPALSPSPPNLSTAPQPTLSPSMDSGYSYRGQTVPGPVWNSTGLVTNPSSVSGGLDGFQNYSYMTSGTGHELALVDATKLHVFVSEYLKAL